MAKMNLKHYKLDSVEETDKELGRGSFAAVILLNFRGLKCAGKKLHSSLYAETFRQDKIALLRRFESECELLSCLHHPNIVQFLGVHYSKSSDQSSDGKTKADNPGVPMLVMEYLHMTLADCIDKCKATLPSGILPIEVCYSILHDVALGLRYLHEQKPPIAHRDLSANNVLLTNTMTAKIADLGLARILEFKPNQKMKLTQCPGTMSYMPPEVMGLQPLYTEKVDIFSFGVLIIHIFAGEWPLPKEATLPDPNNPECVVAINEFKRRDVYIHPDNPLMDLIRRCLSNASHLRPTASELLSEMEEANRQHSPKFLSRIEELEHLAAVANEVESLKQEIVQLSRENHSLKEDATRADSENEMLSRENRALQSSLSESLSKQEGIQANILDLEEHLQRMSARLDAQTSELARKEFFIQQLLRERTSVTSPVKTTFPKQPLAEVKGTAEEEVQDFGDNVLSACRTALSCVEEFSEGQHSLVDFGDLLQMSQTLDEGALIIILGYHNSGKSTLINALLANILLPVSMHSDTSVNVAITHDSQVHFGPCPEPKSCPNCPTVEIGHMSSEYTGKPWRLETKRGADAIVNTLRRANSTVQEGKQVNARYTVRGNVPIIGGVPVPSSVHLVDTPGFGVAEEGISCLCDTTSSTSVACVYVMSYSHIGDPIHMDFIRLLHERDQGLIVEKRLLVVVTQFDEYYTAVDDDEDTHLNEEEVKTTISGRIESAVGVAFPAEKVVPICTQWGHIAQQLRHQTHDEKLKQNALRALHYSSKEPQYQADGTDITTIATKLEETSRVQKLEERIQEMAQVGFIRWIDTISTGCCRLIDDACDVLHGQHNQQSGSEGTKDQDKQVYLETLKKHILKKTEEVL